MKSIYLPTSRNHWNEGTQVKICHEGRVVRGTLADSDDHKHTIGVKMRDGKVRWAHESLVTLDLPEPPQRRRIQAWNF